MILTTDNVILHPFGYPIEEVIEGYYFPQKSIFLQIREDIRPIVFFLE